MNKNVLIVDDDRAIAHLTAIQLRAVGYAVAVAFDGASGLRKARVERFDVIVLDIRMPNMDGFEVNAKLKEDSQMARIPVIFLSASVQEMVKRRAANSGAAAFVPKPYDIEQLVEAIEQALSKEAGQLERMGAHE